VDSPNRTHSEAGARPPYALAPWPGGAPVSRGCLAPMRCPACSFIDGNRSCVAPCNRRGAPPIARGLRSPKNRQMQVRPPFSRSRRKREPFSFSTGAPGPPPGPRAKTGKKPPAPLCPYNRSLLVKKNFPREGVVGPLSNAPLPPPLAHDVEASPFPPVANGDRQPSKLLACPVEKAAWGSRPLPKAPQNRTRAPKTFRAPICGGPPPGPARESPRGQTLNFWADKLP